MLKVPSTAWIGRAWIGVPELMASSEYDADWGAASASGSTADATTEAEVTNFILGNGRESGVDRMWTTSFLRETATR